MTNRDIIAIQAEMVYWRRLWLSADAAIQADDTPCPKCGGLTFNYGRDKMVCQTCPWEENKEEV